MVLRRETLYSLFLPATSGYPARRCEEPFLRAAGLKIRMLEVRALTRRYPGVSSRRPPRAHLVLLQRPAAEDSDLRGHLHHPELIILDQPFSGLDVHAAMILHKGRVAANDSIQRLRDWMAARGARSRIPALRFEEPPQPAVPGPGLTSLN